MPALWIMALIFLVAALLRIWAGIELSRDMRVSDPILDGRYYLDLAERLAGGGGWPDEPHFMTPLYPAVLSVIFRAAPVSVATVQVFQAILGLATLAILFLAVRRDLGMGAAIAAGALFAIYGPILANESQVLVEGLLLFLSAVAIWFWPRAGDRFLRLLLFGVTVGLLTLGRGVYLLLPAAAAAMLILRGRRQLAAQLKPVAWIALGLAVSLLPCAVHQTRTTGKLTILTLNGGINLYIGNNPSARGVYSQPAELDLEQDPTGARSASMLAGQPLTLAESSRFWTRRTLESARERPGRLVWLLARKVMLYMSPDELPQIEAFDLLRETHLPLRAAFVGFGLVLPAAALGVVAWFRRRRYAGVFPVLQSAGAVERPEDGGRSRGPAAAAGRCVQDGPAPGSLGVEPYLILILVGWIATILFFATGRYRIPYMAGFIAAAGYGIHFLWGMIRARRLSRLAAVVPLAVGIQLAIPGYSLDSVRVHDAYQRGIRLQRAGDPVSAIAAYREALKIDHAHGEAWHGMGAALVSMGRLPEAAEAYERAAALLPHTALTRYNLGVVLGRMGHDADAVEWFREAVALDPYDPVMRSDLGVTFARLGRFAEAAEQFREALELDPHHEPSIRHLRSLPPGSG